MSQRDELEFQGGAATKPKAEYGNDGGQNRDHARDGRAVAQKSQPFSVLPSFEHAQPLTNATLPSSENGLAAIFADQKNAMVLISMLSRIGASGGVVGSSNALWPMKRARPSVSES
jgi:hypothetical protein